MLPPAMSTQLLSLAGAGLTRQYTLIGSLSIEEMGLEEAVESSLMLDTEPVGENMSFLGKTSPREMSRLSSPASDMISPREGVNAYNNMSISFLQLNLTLAALLASAGHQP